MKRIVTGLKPTSKLTLANYTAVVKPLVELQEDYEIIIFVADLHAITVRQDRQELRKLIKEFSALYLACGLDSSKVKIFIQSEIMAHAQLGWILMCNSYLGELNRMTQYKDKLANSNVDGLSAGFYVYPALMAADILLYDADFVYVGDDQKQHLELTRDLAIRFNNHYGETFKVPQTKTNEISTRIMDLQDPTVKMSKSSVNEKGCIFMLDSLDIIKKRLRSAVTDSDATIYYDKTNKPGISNLIELYAAFSKKSVDEVVTMFKDCSYKDFKESLSNIIVKEIEPIQKRYYELMNGNELDKIFDSGRDYCSKIAFRKIKKVEHKVGLNRKVKD